MLRPFSSFLLLLLISFSSIAQKTDKSLQKKLEALLSNYNGDIGLYVLDLNKNKQVSINADTVFPTASMVKIPILVGVMDKIEKGELKFDQSLQYSDSLLYAGVDILGSFKNGEKIELGKVAMLMLTMSDNTASLWLQALAGTGTRINELMKELGLEHTRVNSRTPGRESNRTAYGWGQTTPYEMVLLMQKIVEGEVISKEKSQKMLRMLGRNFWDDVSLSQIPTDVFVASKNGAVNQSRSEILFVNGQGARYIFSICTKNNKDQSWGDKNEAWELSRKVSKLLWEHYSKN
jgi:beta-lactamase class A